jgi:hypothetical protein
MYTRESIRYPSQGGTKFNPGSELASGALMTKWDFVNELEYGNHEKKKFTTLFPINKSRHLLCGWAKLENCKILTLLEL